MRLNQMASAITSMTQNSGRVKSLVDQVNTGNQEQARGMEQIARAVLEMERVTQTTAASAQESASAGAELDSEAGKLRDLVRELHGMVVSG